jgi:hypothetical protein
VVDIAEYLPEGTQSPEAQPEVDIVPEGRYSAIQYVYGVRAEIHYKAPRWV